MFKKVALGLAGLCMISSPALANCNQAELASVQKVFEDHTARILSGGDFVNSILVTQSQFNALPLSSACRQYITLALSASPRPSPQPKTVPPGPSIGLPGCVGGICSTPDGYYRAIR